MSSTIHHPPPPPQPSSLPAGRQRCSVRCDRCKTYHAKCEFGYPTFCNQCRKAGIDCIYERPEAKRKIENLGKTNRSVSANVAGASVGMERRPNEMAIAPPSTGSLDVTAGSITRAVAPEPDAGLPSTATQYPHRPQASDPPTATATRPSGSGPTSFPVAPPPRSDQLDDWFLHHLIDPRLLAEDKARGFL
ncbi:hypothetical protein F4780DRAFT_776190 [Xylariomycetidae sp. FL0641]|nr:hypothetical protein F4780DRAFT_776190 [Xylariomycetidae sp. FL0641]